MACDCLETIPKKLEEKFGDDVVLTNTIETLNFTTGVIATKLEPLRFTFPRPKKDGTPSLKRDKSFVMFTFCPFCGVRYVPEKSEATQ